MFTQRRLAPSRAPRAWRTRIGCLLLGLAAWLLPLAAVADAASLQARYAQLRGQLKPNANGHSLVVESTQQQDRLTGDVSAVLEHPFSAVQAALKSPASWCDVMILPFNTKYCHAVDGADGPTLLLRIGRKFDQPLDRTYKLQLAWRNVATTPDYFETRMDAADGPIGTRDYRIALAAVPIEGNRTFVRLTYSYGYGFSGRVAMQAYLGTVGADKVGFTVVGKDAKGEPQYIGGVRGAIERTAMRYYLAIDAYVDSLRAPPQQQLDRRIQAWYAATDRYPRQLREMDRPTYVAMKRQEVERQQQLIE
ncbi:hypothetical protein ACPWT1_07430 [Ramlibacter sp. MMS24-I3-19]|uniref:hypothetical protein n=1 Tax=Ramlibacter sp. MMS24-I3-19 TaxID=3416606 RepID=UPI003D04AC2F